jgi:lauroyl/myristoyl acyltransferase
MSSTNMNRPSHEAVNVPVADPEDRLNRYRRIKRLLAAVPYRYGAAVLALAATNPLLQRAARSHRERLRSFMRELGIDAPIEQAFARYLSCNVLLAWRLSALAKCSDEEFARWVTIRGESVFSELRAQKRPVILCNSHYGSGKTVLLALIRQGHVVHSLDRHDVFAFFDIQARGRLVSINLGARDQGFMLKPVVQARNVLNEGGILHIAADGLRGQSGRAIPFLGRERRFPTSVAELAQLTGAAVIPVFGALDVKGRVTLEFLPPLSAPAAGLPREEAVDHIVRQYRDLLEARWLADPGSIWKSELANWPRFPRLAAEEAN